MKSDWIAWASTSSTQPWLNYMFEKDLRRLVTDWEHIIDAPRLLIVRSKSRPDDYVVLIHKELLERS